MPVSNSGTGTTSRNSQTLPEPPWPRLSHRSQAFANIFTRSPIPVDLTRSTPARSTPKKRPFYPISRFSPTSPPKPLPQPKSRRSSPQNSPPTPSPNPTQTPPPPPTGASELNFSPNSGFMVQIKQKCPTRKKAICAPLTQASCPSYTTTSEKYDFFGTSRPFVKPEKIWTSRTDCSKSSIMLGLEWKAFRYDSLNLHHNGVY